MQMEKVSVVVCVRNEEKRIEECLQCIIASQPDEIVVVDGGSTDRTVEIAQRYTTNVIRSIAANLTRDRQIGIDAARNEYIAMIDADHRLAPGDIQSLLNDLKKYRFDIVQSQVILYNAQGFWNRAEEETWFLVHNIPGPKKMIGVAPAVYKKAVFDKVRFDDYITTRIDDTDFIYRLSKFPEIKIGVGETQVRQLHFGSFKTYVRKFIWYGIGDGQFCRKHPHRTWSMIFHLTLRYPLLYSFRALRCGKWRAALFCVLQGWIRFYGLITYFLRRSSQIL